MIKTLYFSHQIRGADGERATPKQIEDNLKLGCARAAALMKRFPTIRWIVPHANEILNMAHRMGLISSQNIINVERAIIRGPHCDGVVVVGIVHADGGVEQEMDTAFAHNKFFCRLDDVNEKDFIQLAVKISAWNEDAD